MVDRRIESVRTLRAFVRRLTVGRLALALLIATACAAVFATRVYTNVESVRIKALGVPASPSAGTVRIRVANERTRALPSPFAVVANIRNGSSGEQRFSISVDDISLCDP